ncbi:MAG: HEPN domain-containing protein [Chitinophagales bacterium]|nr:HEPN domain-containing protein [Chitinophagales bacterium]
MQSFRTELENPLVEKDIIELERKIREFREGKMDEQKFRSLRLARGVYGMRQQGVQMVRIKLPYGKLTAKQLERICDVSDKYSHRILHLTTRQDIQIHYVSLDVTPQLWAELEQDDITLREACGNTVRNITASSFAGIDKDELFDVTPYAHAMFEYFLRNPVCQEMGRKVKIAFSSSDADDALTFMHDFGFIPRIENEQRGFKVLVGGGLGNQAHHAFTAYEFLPEEQLIPFVEAGLRVFDRYGEREKRLAARLKFLIKQIGAEEYMRLVHEEWKSLLNQTYKVDTTVNTVWFTPPKIVKEEIAAEDAAHFETWKRTNVFPQKQEGYSAVAVKILIGNIDTDTARLVAEIARQLTGDDMRVTVSQNFLFRFVPNENLPALYNALKKIGLNDAGYESTLDITSCPGTSTCNLGVASSMGVTKALEDVIRNEYPQLVAERNILIKISGCMNSCGQHVIANIGFQGMSTPVGKDLAPAFQVLLGGGKLGNGQGRFAEKSIKVFSKRAPDALRALLNDYAANATSNESFNDYYDRNGKEYFNNLLKPFGEKVNITPDLFVDWDAEEAYAKAVGTGECAGVMIDLVQTLFVEAEEKLENASYALSNGKLADAAYHVYASLIHASKALLVSVGARTNTHKGIIDLFDKEFVETGKIKIAATFSELALKVNAQIPDEKFVQTYLQQATDFLKTVRAFRKEDVTTA